MGGLLGRADRRAGGFPELQLLQLSGQVLLSLRPTHKHASEKGGMAIVDHACRKPSATEIAEVIPRCGKQCY